MMTGQIFKFIDNNLNELISELQILIRQPSISAKNEGIEECAKLVAKTLKKSGISSEILRLKKGVAPLIFGEVKSKQNPNKTLLFYNHYDVQPVEPLDLWNDDPFSGKIKGNKIFGRGSSDDKGELITRIKAVEAFLRAKGDVPCNREDPGQIPGAGCLDAAEEKRAAPRLRGQFPGVRGEHPQNDVQETQ